MIPVKVVEDGEVRVVVTSELIFLIFHGEMEDIPRLPGCTMTGIIQT
jgi:hypothetical protein